MKLTDFRTLGRSGLVVSPLALGTMTFGTDRWGADESSSRAIFDAYRSAGGNFVDTADIYSGGMSEKMVGRFISETGARDEVVLATKFGFNGTTNPNAGGNGAKNIHRALDASLTRLGTDHVDLYWMHVWDGVTPVEEILGTLGDLVQAGKIRYFGLSDMPTWVALKARTIADVRAVPGPIAVQVEYSLVARSVERVLVAGCLDGGMAVQPWSPLAGGFLAGKYARGETDGKGRLSGDNPFGDTKFTDRNWAMLDTLREVAKGVGCTAASGLPRPSRTGCRLCRPGKRRHAAVATIGTVCVLRPSLAAQQPVERGTADVVELGRRCHQRLSLRMPCQQRRQSTPEHHDRLDGDRDARAHYAAWLCNFRVGPASSNACPGALGVPSPLT